MLLRVELCWDISLVKSCSDELSLISSWHFPGACGNVKGLSSACLHIWWKLRGGPAPHAPPSGKGCKRKQFILEPAEGTEPPLNPSLACTGILSSQSSPSSTALLRAGGGLGPACAVCAGVSHNCLSPVLLLSLKVFSLLGIRFPTSQVLKLPLLMAQERGG